MAFVHICKQNKHKETKAVEEGNMFDEERLMGMRRFGGKLHSKEREETALC